MLKSLTIRNVVLIDKLDLEFPDGLSVLSGETGAGKSILLDSLGLLLGNRADAGMVRKGADKLVVSGVFVLKDKNNPFFALCAENGIELDDEIIIKRMVETTGHSRILINDQPVSQRFLKEAAAHLVEIHGQFDNQGLLNTATHLDVLDSFGGYSQILAATIECWRNYRHLCKQLERAEQEYNAAKEEEETLRHWVDELEKANLRPGEEEDLTRKRNDNMHAEKLLENFSTAYNAVQGHELGSLIQKAQAALSRVNALTEDRFADISEALDTALIQLDEATARMEQATAEINLSNAEADAIEERLFALKALARKHQTDISGLPAVLAEFKAKLAALDKGGEELSQLKQEVKEARTVYVKEAQSLGSQRRHAAAQLDKAVMNELPPLKMDRAVFETAIEDLPEAEWHEKGMQRVMFTVATNPNSAQGALSKIASGGELARFMLALKVNLAQKSSVETLVFDEVDTGIGGATAQAVGERLAKLAGLVQVLVVTHSPQVAAFSHQHFKVSKHTVDNTTTTTVEVLDAAQKKEEIARMLSGQTITDEARAAADVLISGKKI